MFSTLINRLGLAAVVLGLAAGAYAVTATNTVPTTKAGDGNSAISGYTVSAVHYTPNATNAANVDSFTFTLDTAPPAGAAVQARVVSSGSFISCSFSGTAVTCPSTGTLSGITVASLDDLHVTASQ